MLPKTSINLLFASYTGLPITSSPYFGWDNYYETAAYVGVVVLVLAGLALLLRWRSSLVVGFAASAVICAALAYSALVIKVVDLIPLVKNVQWSCERS